ncbi:phosphatase PAP2 family protein [Streptomyces sp. NPDC058067]|uniref:phosphatase PAP2 family protein n=1 Tax=Streptomyces sp. NPDC058067 TaxID=3346324 RepID=UPI0036EF7611
MSQTEAPPTAATAGDRLRWWTELPLILVVYAAYSMGRLLVRGDTASAVGHGLAILRAEKALHLNLEHPLNRLFTSEAWIGVPADFWYASLHYLVTPGILIWLFRSRAGHFRAARTWLMTSTLIGLIGFTLLPTCPPRLLAPGHGFVDTMAQYSSWGWWGTEASAPRGLGGMTNQYAAMPSLHVGWAVWCGVMLWRHGRTPLTRAAGIAYPLITTFVVMGTANHYLFDALAGVAVIGLGFAVSRPVLRVAGMLRNRVRGAFAPGSPGYGHAPSTSPFPVASSIVSGECQTSTGERIPRQRKASAAPGGGPGARPADAGDGAPAPVG